MVAWIRSRERAHRERSAPNARGSLRELAFSVLSLMAPLVSFVFGGAGGLGLLTCLGFYVGPPHTHFPMALMLGLSIGSLVVAALYSSLLHALDPEN